MDLLRFARIDRWRLFPHDWSHSYRHGFILVRMADYVRSSRLDLGSVACWGINYVPMLLQILCICVPTRKSRHIIPVFTLLLQLCFLLIFVAMDGCLHDLLKGFRPV